MGSGGDALTTRIDLPVVPTGHIDLAKLSVLGLPGELLLLETMTLDC